MKIPPVPTATPQWAQPLLNPLDDVRVTDSAADPVQSEYVTGDQANIRRTDRTEGVILKGLLAERADRLTHGPEGLEIQDLKWVRPVVKDPSIQETGREQSWRHGEALFGMLIGGMGDVASTLWEDYISAARKLAREYPLASAQPWEFSIDANNQIIVMSSSQPLSEFIASKLNANEALRQSAAAFRDRIIEIIEFERGPDNVTRRFGALDISKETFGSTFKLREYLHAPFINSTLSQSRYNEAYLGFGQAENLKDQINSFGVSHEHLQAYEQYNFESGKWERL